MMSVEQPIMITDTNSDDGVKDDFNSDDLKTLDNNQWLNDKVSKFLHQRSMIVLAARCNVHHHVFPLSLSLFMLAFCSLKQKRDLLYIPSCSVQRGK